MLCLALVAVPVLVLEPEGLPRLRGLEKELDDVTTENADSYREVERLRVEVRELRDDPAAVERIARGELGHGPQERSRLPVRQVSSRRWQLR